jgi:hypothetical protein
MRSAPDPLVSRLVLEAEIEAERTLSIVRIGIALILATWAFSVAGFGRQAAPTAQMLSELPPGLVIGVLLLIASPPMLFPDSIPLACGGRISLQYWTQE